MLLEDLVRSTDEEKEFLTFFNYALALQLLFTAKIKSSSSLVRTLITNLPAPTQQPVDRSKIEICLRRAWATEALMRIPYTREDLKETAGLFLLWLPVQTYYAAHSALQAALIAHGHDPRRHRVALNQFASALRKKTVTPLRCACVGATPDYEYFDITPDKNYSNLSQPATVEDAWHLTGKALRTTRKDIVVDCARQQSKGKKRAKAGLKQQIANTEVATTILHLLYRLRIRSNYGESDTFISGYKPHDCLRLGSAYVCIADYTLGTFEAMVEQRLGKGTIESIAKRFLKTATGLDAPIFGRWSIA